ncbi:RIP metalloprotease RseP [Croceicoccus naphthovorans]|uniref:Zinc metalloprotease n=1 Tax=Croceicoccus naphthovorans TaxID=1348774 RepID=A0A0G3XGG2_9SPHN|nr:RIP metalloprotease RseP [Croceicoccus naphthovorans]AKM10595.1 peptidase [Croceicoccus naphthovorans]MBB3988814.1 regulator of sigma E protease [Croceicoccus naphthovorans]
MFENPNLFTAIVGFIAVLAPLVVVHELGHYLVGRWFGVKAEAFSVGFGKEIAGFTDKRGTRWKLSAIPLGGYVQFAGDMSPSSQPTDEWKALPEAERNQTFQSKGLGARAAIVAAGPLTNLLVAIIIMAGFIMAFGKIVAEPVVGEIYAESAAAEAGIDIGDRITSVNGSAIDSFDDLRELIVPYPGETATLTWLRDGREMRADIVIGTHVEVDRFGNRFEMGRIGIAANAVDAVEVGPLEAVAEGTRQTLSIMKLSAVGLWQIITGRRGLDELGGPVKIAKYSGEQLVQGWYAYIGFVAMISINLAFINLLPIPVLDGGHLAFYAIEAVRRRPVSAKGQDWAFRTGLALVLGLMVFVTFLDISSLNIFGS